MHAIIHSLPGLMHELPDNAARKAIAASIWPNVLGAHLRERSLVTALDNGVLHVAVSSLEWKQEFEQHAGEIVYKLNRALGSSTVRRIELTVDRKSVERARPKRAKVDITKTDHVLPTLLENSSAAIADPELRKNFLEAAAACIERRDAR